MAHKILMQIPGTDKVKNGMVGFSWTTFIFTTMMVALFRKDWKMAFSVWVISLLIFLPTSNFKWVVVAQGIQNSFSAVSIASEIWIWLDIVWGLLLGLGGGLFYNKIYTKGLIKRGWRPLTQRDEDFLRKYNIKVPADYELHSVIKVEK